MAYEEPGTSPGDGGRRVASDRRGGLGRPAALAALAAATLCLTAACSSSSSAPANSAPAPATPAAAGGSAVPVAGGSAPPATSAPASAPAPPVARSGGVIATAASPALIARLTAISAAESTDVSTNPLAGCHIDPAKDHLADVAVTSNGWAEATVVVPAGQQGQENVFKRAHGTWAVYTCGTSLVGSGPVIPADVDKALGQVQADLRAAGG